MEKLLSLHTWSHCKKVNGKLKAPALGLDGKTSCIDYTKAKRNAENEILGSPYFGMVFDKDQTEYFGIDVDVDKTGKKLGTTEIIPVPLLDFIHIRPTHVHYSPNGEGLHLIYRLSPEAQQVLIELQCKQGSTSIGQGSLYTGDWRYRSSFLVFTENYYIVSSDKIATLSLDDLTTLIPTLGSKQPEVQQTEPPQTKLPEIVFPQATTSPTAIPTIEDLKSWLAILPPTLDHVAVQACSHLDYSRPNTNYEYWLFIGMACAHLATLKTMSGNPEEVEHILKTYDDWSSKDEDSYGGPEVTADKFNQLYYSTAKKIEEGEHHTTVSVLPLLVRYCGIQFPDLVTKALVPNVNSIRNIQALIEHDGLGLSIDTMTGGYCFTGSEDLVLQWFCPKSQEEYKIFRLPHHGQVVHESELDVHFQGYMQNRFRNSSISQTTAKAAIRHIAKTVTESDAFKGWIESTPWKGEDVLTQVIDSITFDTESEEHILLYKKMLRCMFLSMVGIHTHPEDTPKINAIVVFSGPENCRKSSWAGDILPPEMQQYKGVPSTYDMLKGGRDWEAQLCTNAVLVLDECEVIFHPKHEQKLKASIDKDIVTYRGVFEKTTVSRKRTAVVIGTTNQSELYSGDMGTRKLHHIPVLYCDNTVFERVNRQQLYAHCRHILIEFGKANLYKKVQSSWSFSKDELYRVNLINKETKGEEHGLSALLLDLFGESTRQKFIPEDFMGPSGKVLACRYSTAKKSLVFDNDPRFWSAPVMSRYLASVYPSYPGVNDISKVRYALEQYSSWYTGTTTEGKKLFSNVAERGSAVQKIVVKRGRVESQPGHKNNTKLYLMPTIKEIEEQITAKVVNISKFNVVE